MILAKQSILDITIQKFNDIAKNASTIPPNNNRMTIE